MRRFRDAPARVAVAWLVLLTATLLSWESARSSGDYRLASAVVLLIAFLKARLIGLEFMELRAAPLRICVEITLLVEIGQGRRIGHPFVEVADSLAAVHFGPSMLRISASKPSVDVWSTEGICSNPRATAKRRRARHPANGPEAAPG